MKPNPEEEFWSKVIEGNALAIARALIEHKVCRLTMDYMTEGEEVWFGVEIHAGVDS